MESISWMSLVLEASRDLTLEAARDVGPRKTIRPVPAAQIKKLLDSRNERDVLEGLRRVIAMQYSNPPQPTLTYFPAVLKTLSNPFPSTRPLVYNYLIHHAEADPDTALLSINTIQKSLSDSNARVRAMALKTMAGIRVPVISQIVSLAIKKGVSDLSPIVRKAAALACVKCVRLDPATRPQVEEYLASLLADKQYYVAGAAVQAFGELCPDRLDLIHPVYRRLCRMVVDMDEWGQLALLRLMTTYARRCFPRRTKRVKRAQTQEEKAKDFYDDIEAPVDEHKDEFDEVEDMDPDLELLLKSIQPLLHSRNSAVVVAVTRTYLYLSPSNYLHRAIGPLMALLRSPQDIQQVTLYNIVQVCLTNPALFVPHLRRFLLRSTEAPQTWRLKLEILTLVFPHCGKELQLFVLAELEHFSRSHDAALVRESVRAIGRCAQVSNEATAKRCLSLLLKQIRSPDQHLVGEAIEVVRHLIQRSPDEHRKTVIRLAKHLDTLVSPTARASIVWLVGEFSGADVEQNVAADVLRILLKGYADEDDEVRAQIVLLAAKVYLHYLNAKNAQQGKDTPSQPNAELIDTSTPTATSPRPTLQDNLTDAIPLLYTHTLLLARYTPSYSLRDRARLFRALLSNPASTELASLLLLAPKPVPQAPSPSESRKTFTLGSASLVIGAEAGMGGLRGYEGVPEWVEEGREPDPGLREDGKEGYVSGAGGITAGQKLDEALKAEEVVGKSGAKGKTTLEDWLDDEEGEGGEYDELSEEEEDEEDEEEDEDDDDEEDENEETEEESEDEDDEKAGLVK